MQPIQDLTSHRRAKWLKALHEVRVAQTRLESAVQLEGADALLSQLEQPGSVAELIAMVDAVEFAVDALCNEGRTGEARVLASDADGVVRSLHPGYGGYPGKPRSLVGFRVARVHARAIELDGDSVDAMSRLMALYARLSREPQLGDTRVEAIRTLRGVLSAAKRDGGGRARQFADYARRHGDELARELAPIDPAAACSYYHRAAIECRSRPGSGARGEAIELFEASLPLRPDTLRDRKSRGMVVGDLRVLRGEREEGARILTSTVNGFEGVLPRHYESARKQLMARDLLIAA